MWTTDSGGARRLLVATADELAAGLAEPVTPDSLQVREILSVDGDTVLFSASAAEPTEISLWTYGPDGLAAVDAEARQVQTGRLGGGTIVTATRTLESAGLTVRVLRDGKESRADRRARRTPAAARPAPGALRRRGARRPYRAAAAVLAPAGLGTAAGPARPLRRPARADGAGGQVGLPHLAVAGRTGLRGGDRGRPRHPRARPAVGAGHRRRGVRAGPGRPGGRAARGGGPLPGPGHQPGSDPRLVVRRLPGRAGRAAPARCVPRRDRRCPGHRLAAV